MEQRLANGQAPQAGTTAITFQSSTCSDFRQLLTREAATGTVTIRANLGFPEEKKDRYPAVVVVHTIGGYRDANEVSVAELRKSGFATLTYDSFAAQAKPFDPSSFAACVGAAPGYSMAFDAAVRAQSITDAARFLQRNLQP